MNASTSTPDAAGGFAAPPGAAIDTIPRQHLINMLKDAAWCSGDRECYKDHQGYSYDVNEETSLRDVLYRDEPLYKTQEEAIIAHWKRHYSPNAKLKRGGD